MFIAVPNVIQTEGFESKTKAGEDRLMAGDLSYIRFVDLPRKMDDELVERCLGNHLEFYYKTGLCSQTHLSLLLEEEVRLHKDQLNICYMAGYNQFSNSHQAVTVRIQKTSGGNWWVHGDWYGSYAKWPAGTRFFFNSRSSQEEIDATFAEMSEKTKSAFMRMKERLFS